MDWPAIDASTVVAAVAVVVAAFSVTYQTKLAREARRFEVRRVAYGDMVRELMGMRRWIREKSLRPRTAETPPDPIDESEWDALWAQFVLFGSATVRDLYGDYRELAMDIEHQLEQEPEGDDEAKLEERVDMSNRKFDELVGAMRSELMQSR